MSNKIKRFLVLACALCLVFSSATFANAAELPDSYSSESEDITPRATPWYITFDTGSSRTTATACNFTVLGRAYGLFCNVNVSAPCTVYVLIKDRSTGSYLGSNSFNITRAGNFNFNMVPSSLTSGNYELSYWFSQSGISYTFIPQGYTAN